MTQTVDEAVWAILHEALRLYQDSPRATSWLRHHIGRFDSPLRIAVAGRPGSGKSTVVNAVVGDEVAPIEVDGPVFTWYQDGPQPRATVYMRQGPPGEPPIVRVGRRMDIDLSGFESGGMTRIVVDWPARVLRDATLIDTPPIADEISEQIAAEADALLYLTPQVHVMDVRYLQSTQDHPVARAAPVNSIMVLSRADEVGGGRIDSLSTAKQISRRYRRDARIRGLCQNVVAVSGLIGQAGRTMPEEEYQSLAALAAAPRAQTEELLLTADRFTRSEHVLPVSTRRELADRLGMVGIRLATTLIRQGADSRTKLASELVQRSGLNELRDSIGRLFVDRREVLKARSALLGLDVVLRMEPRPGAAKLVTDVERVLAGAHEFHELRLLGGLLSGRTRLPEELGLEAQRLIGGYGTDLDARLGFDREPTQAEVQNAIYDALARWREQSENPMLGSAERDAARVVVRSCEAMLI
ncbi:hypothetical protein KIPE111705_40905 [Kibdelosporangium persicum]|uniref:Isoniazid inducible protein IniC n=1 Tax=Kibdelosporangium persicum TaxID=2698649 RepID=A0ABX2FIM5_9PSEU|nr:hypothetical protein [Kibdelosporangium persicum]NRN71274.1 Isoniazid inducible protein IniC [Kibdelosporangium persicum]